ncbi:MAG: PRC-barrel domain-containing protein [Betaproteobacteria bacterium]
MVTQANPYGSTTQARSGAQIIPSDTPNTSGPGPEVMDAATLQGDKIVNAAGDDLGKIEAIMLDVTSGRIAYAVLSFGGFLGMGAKLFAIPWGALTLDAREKQFVLDVSKEKLESAEGFDKDHWPSMADPNWAAELHAYYNVTPYWEDDEQDLRGRRSTLDTVAGEPKVY